MLELFALLPALLVIGIPIWLFVRSVKLNRRVEVLENEIRVLKKHMDDVEVAPIEASVAFEKSEEPEKPLKSEASETVSQPARPDPKPAGVQQKPIEEWRGNPQEFDWFKGINWLVWIGGAALALGGIFIVKYSIDYGFLGPWPRLILSLLLGIGMLSVGEWFRRQPEQAKNLTSWAFLPLAVSSAGLIVIYGALYAGFTYLELYPAFVAIILLALTAFVGMAYSLMLGPILAAVGMLGAYLVPILVSTKTASTELLFIYLFAILMGSMLILRYRSWNWIAAVNLVVSSIWVVLWELSGSHTPVDVFVVEIYLVLTAALFIYYFMKPAVQQHTGFSFFKREGLLSPRTILYATFLMMSIFGLFLAIGYDHQNMAIFLAVAIAPLSVLVARDIPNLKGLPVIAHATILLLLLSWPDTYLRLAFNSYEYGSIATAELSRFTVLCALAALHFVAYGAWCLFKNSTSMLGAAHAVASPVLVFCIAYWKCNQLGTSPEWAAIALTIAGVSAIAATKLSKNLPEGLHNSVIAIFLIGATAGLSLALAVALEKEWLTIALAVQLAATAWVYHKIPVAAFRPLASLLAILVIVRLELDGEVLRFLGRSGDTMDWFFYGFGIPIVCFGFAWFLFKRKKTDYLAMLLESGTILFWITLLALCIRYFAGVESGTEEGRLFNEGSFSFAELSVHVVSLLANAFGLYWLNTKETSPVRVWGWKILGTLGAAQLVIILMLSANPLILFNGGVGSWYVVDWLFVAYLLPAGLFLMFRRIALTEHAQLSFASAVAASILGFLYLNTEIRHLFVGRDIRLGHFSDLEFYTYSVAWLVVGGVSLFCGIWRDNLYVKRAAFILILATVGKVFLFDMSKLDGLLRAISFLGLGASLIGLGFLFQRYGQTKKISQEQNNVE